ncbi:hypothetical protein FZC35_00595 [Candidatus Cytomitobacter indipagum]|uniref:ABC-2 type transporter transmembrane domain-containing protein n=1 Tax=Candidatus Cytomitobacter indipagum TaxID=2601575 RepID=A0A5C0UFQ9_9PROT|nr:ABC transporter permease [Candidatus Cytomitobacter indipagum]QEK37884.1 hypothetical protein FZC35_00595 [Candidatus Cytomitobacter indipagum]
MITFLRLIQMECMIIVRNMTDSLINNAIFCTLIALVSGYIFKAFGTSSSFASLQAASLIVSVVGFESYRSIFRLLSDLEGEKHIQYYFTLPIANSLIFLKMVLSFVFNGVLFGTFSLFILRIVLFKHIILKNINFGLFFLTLTVIGGFFGTFSFFLAAYTKNMMKIGNTLMRILFPMWIIGGFQFSYAIAKSISPILGYIALCSPYTYANEAMRYVVLGSGDFINIWISLPVLIIFTLLCWVFGIRKLRKRLDFI